MPVFKKKKKSISEKKEVDASSLKEKRYKKKKKIGFRHKNNNDNYDQVVVSNDSPPQSSKLSSDSYEKHGDTDVFDEISSDEHDDTFEKLGKNASISQKDWSSTKRKTVIKKDMKGMPVFLEDTGDKIGTVFDSIYDKDNHLIGYKIKDNKSDSILSFSLDQFGEDKTGLIFIPSWYTKAVQLIEKLEFKDRISPELTWLLKDNTITEEELYHIFVKHDDTIASYIDESKALRELLLNRLRILEKERLSLKEALMDLTEKRLIKDIDRRKFSEIVMAHRQKVNVLDVNILKCKQLIHRLEETSFGLLSAHLAVKKYDTEVTALNNKKFTNQPDRTTSNSTVDRSVENNPFFAQAPHNNYNQIPKDELKNISSNQKDERYSNLQEEYNKLKELLEKSINNKNTDQNRNIVEKNLQQIDEEYKQKYLDLKNRFDNQQKEYEKIKHTLNDKKTSHLSDEAYDDIKIGYDELKKDYEVLKQALENNITNPYEEKYYTLKQEYEDLKISVEKLLQKNHE